MISKAFPELKRKRGGEWGERESEGQELGKRERNDTGECIKVTEISKKVNSAW